MARLPDSLIDKIIGYASEDMLGKTRFISKRWMEAMPKELRIPLSLVSDMESARWAASLFEDQLCEDMIAFAAYRGNIMFVQALRELGCPWDDQTCCEAAYGGHLDVLMWAVEYGCPVTEDVALAAIEGGHFRVIQWYVDSVEFPRTHRMCSIAARFGRLDMLAMMRDQGCPFDRLECEAEAAYAGHNDFFQWMLDNGMPLSDLCIDFAIKGNRFETVKWVVEKGGAPMNCDTAAYAAKCGRLEMLQWLRSKGCPWDVTTLVSASLFGHVHVHDWAVENGCEWDV